MKRSPALILAFTLLLAACSSSSSGKCTQEYWDGTVGMCLVDGWSVLDKETRDRRGAPGEVVAAFQKDQSVAGQYPTIVVTKEAILPGTDSTALSQASIRSVTTLPGYKLIDSRPLTVDGKPVNVHVFSAKPQVDEPERRFYQVSVAKDDVGYTYTAIAPLSIGGTLQSEITVMLNAITLTAPGGSSAASSK